MARHRSGWTDHVRCHQCSMFPRGFDPPRVRPGSGRCQYPRRGVAVVRYVIRVNSVPARLPAHRRGIPAGPAGRRRLRRGRRRGQLRAGAEQASASRLDLPFGDRAPDAPNARNAPRRPLPRQPIVGVDARGARFPRGVTISGSWQTAVALSRGATVRWRCRPPWNAPAPGSRVTEQTRYPPVCNTKTVLSAWENLAVGIAVMRPARARLV